MANERMRDFWSRGAAGWVTHRRIFDQELQGFADAVLDAIAPAPGMRILDIGCGTGTLLEQAVATGASGCGVDISPAMVDAAAQRVPGASFVVADAQTDELDGPYDAAMSRFGVMFFEDPLAAFANIRSALSPGAPLAFACWRGLEENRMFSLGVSVLLDRLDPKPPTPEPGAPGPMAFADPDRVRSILRETGWSDISIEPVDVPCDYGIDGTDGVEERLVMVVDNPTGQLARAQLETGADPEAWEGLLDDIRAELRRNLVDGRVLFNGAGWLVRARA